MEGFMSLLASPGAKTFADLAGVGMQGLGLMNSMKTQNKTFNMLDKQFGMQQDIYNDDKERRERLRHVQM